MTPCFKAVIFDLDDTLFDCTRQLIPNAVRDMCTCHVRRGEFGHLTPLNRFETPDFVVTDLTGLIPLCVAQETN